MTAGSDPGNTQVPIQQQSQSGGPGCLKAMGILTMLMLAALLVLGFLAWNTVDGILGGLGQGISSAVESVAALPQTVTENVKEALKSETRASIEMENLVLLSIQPLGQLVSVSNQYAEPNISVSVQDGFLGLCGGAVNHVVKGTVEAGFDLYKVEAMDVVHEEEGDSWILQLPPPELTSCRIDYIRQYERTFTLCRKDWDEYRLLAESVVLPKIVDEALAEGILDTAKQEASFALGSFLRALTGSSNIRIEFRDEPVADLPASCTRELPPGWKFDEESDSWVKE